MENLLTNPPDPEIGLLKSLVLNEYVGNLLTPKFKSSRLGRLYRHDKLCVIANLDPKHPILKKLEKKFANFQSNTWNVTTSSSITNPNTYCPTKTKILHGSRITSKNIRSLDVLPQNLAPKMLMNTTTDGLTKLGNLIAKMKKFGMVEQDTCERCGNPETIEHQLMTCSYVKEIWSLTSKLTSIPTLDLNSVMGYHDYHDITTITIHSEIIRRLLAIEHPTQNIHKFIKSVITRLGVVERGTKNMF